MRDTIGAALGLVALGSREDARRAVDYVWGSIVDNVVVEYAPNGAVQIDVVELLWPTLTDASTLIRVNLAGFPALPVSANEPASGTSTM